MGGSGERPTRSGASDDDDDDDFVDLFVYLFLSVSCCSNFLCNNPSALTEDSNPTPLISFNEALQYFQTTDLGDLLVRNAAYQKSQIKAAISITANS